MKITLLSLCILYLFRIFASYIKLDNVMDLLHSFILGEWKFENNNTKELWISLSEEDRKTFWFDFDEFDWNMYNKIYINGMKKHILHENEYNLKKALAKSRRYMINVLLKTEYIRTAQCVPR